MANISDIHSGIFLPENGLKKINNPKGTYLNKSVTWLRGESTSQLQQLFRRVAAAALATLLVISLIGIPLLVLATKEWKRQKEVILEATPSCQFPTPREHHSFALDKVTTVKKQESTNVHLQSAKKPFNVYTQLNPHSIMFQGLRKETKNRLKSTKFLIDQKDVLQRFTNLPCVAETAIAVKGCKYPYLHANHVKFKKEHFPETIKSLLLHDVFSHRILTQAPIGKSTDPLAPNTQEQFWRAALENTNVIVDLTKPSDNIAKYHSKIIHKFGASSGQMKFGDITVTTRQIKKMKYGIKVYQIQVSDASTGKETDITRIHYPNWNDLGGISKRNFLETEYLISLEDHIKSLYQVEKPTITHCRTGVERAGAYMVSSALTELKEAELLPKEDSGLLSKILFDLILAGRQQRGEEFIQSVEQLETLHNLSSKLIERGSNRFDIGYSLLPYQTGRISIPDTTALDTDKEIILGEEKKANDPQLLIEALAQTGIKTQEQINEIEKSITKVNNLIQENKLTDEEKTYVFINLKKIKDSSGKKWASSYTIKWSDPCGPESIDLPDFLKKKINYTMNQIKSNVPEAVQEHSAYHPALILKENPIKETSMMAVKESQRHAEKLGKTKNATYLYRDSSSRSGPPGIMTFTMTYSSILQKNKSYNSHVRFAYNSNTHSWQLAQPLSEQNKSNPTYDTDSSSIFVHYKNITTIETLKNWYGTTLTFDKDGSIINKFETLEDLTKVFLSKTLNLRSSLFLPIRRT